MTKILVLDDEEIIQTSARRVLEPAGYWVKTTASPKEALELTRTFSIDLVLSDLKMPEMDGLEFLKRIKEISPATEVIIITGFGTVRGAVEALRYGAFDYIEKPLNPDDLLRTVGRCIERKKLLAENVRLKREVRALYSLENIIGASSAMQKVFDLIATVAPVDSTVLITGDSGTGKELVSRAIHFNSPRREGPFVVIDCVTIPETLMESELFGHVKGSFTGAVTTGKGLIDLAEGGTLFFDEIGNLPLTLQAKLLRVLQEKEYRPVGARHTQKADVRFIAATNRDLLELVVKGVFREDFYYRLNVFPIKLPPLRERREDIAALAHHFLKKYSARTGKDVEFISAEAMRLLAAHDWPGNVRELENIIHRAVILARSKTVGQKEIMLEETPLPSPQPSPRGRGRSPAPGGTKNEGDFRAEATGAMETDGPVRETDGAPRTLKELRQMKKRLREESAHRLERAFVLDALRRAEWNVSQAARETGMERTNLHALIKKYGLKREEG
ncbi:MAG: sigma-54 dependent transcriptional regulator [Nitrospiraceae bacterium]|nr:sigma-54 dependent transcriptional regulator [Nitrospiraceae bacterium]